MIRLALLCLLLAHPALAAFESNGLELVYSYPIETTLDEPDLRRARDAWPAMFDAAKKTIDVEQFYITPGEGLEPSLAALKRAGERGVRIRFLLEKKFERNSVDGIKRLKEISNLETRIIEWSKVNGAGIVHAKFFVVDGREAYVGSQNFDYRAMDHIHELGLRIARPELAKQVQAIFDHDWKAAVAEAPKRLRKTRPELVPAALAPNPRLVASPWAFNPDGVGDSETELVRLLGDAKESVLVQLLDYKPVTFGKPKRYYAPIDAALRDAAVRGVKVRLLVSHWNTEEGAVEHLKSLALLPGVEIKIITVPEAKAGPIPFSRVAHSKYMVADGRVLWLGTSNWAGGYFDDSRNLELVAADEALAERATRVFAHLWGSPWTKPLDLAAAYPKPRR